MSGVKALPPTQIPEGENENNFFSILLGLLCGVLCKDTKQGKNSTLISLSELKFDGFSKDICRSMVAMLDTDRSGKLGYQEFTNLWSSILQWKKAWRIYDIDKSGTFSGFELREALNTVGYRLNNRILNVLMHRYGTKIGHIHFDDFMMCAVKLKTMIDLFREKDTSETNTATFSMEDWLETTLYT
ncbi:hypothetical protein JTB14_020206 [Gonioctena quinquepunctata]|nr:hypothetical protein JTB14_020206 [Gonioctena quinquepunctata]